MQGDPRNENVLGSCTVRPDEPLLASVDLQVSAMEMMVHWGRCSLTANFLAGYLAPTFGDSESARAEISIMLDELIENAVKFCADVEEPVAVTVDSFGNAIRLRVSNLCDEHHAHELTRAIAQVLSGNPEELFVQQVESAAVGDSMASRLGFITLSMNDSARLGAEVTRSEREGMYEVTVQVMLERDDVEPTPTSASEAAQC